MKFLFLALVSYISVSITGAVSFAGDSEAKAECAESLSEVTLKKGDIVSFSFYPDVENNPTWVLTRAGIFRGKQNGSYIIGKYRVLKSFMSRPLRKVQPGDLVSLTIYDEASEIRLPIQKSIGLFKGIKEDFTVELSNSSSVLSDVDEIHVVLPGDLVLVSGNGKFDRLGIYKAQTKTDEGAITLDFTQFDIAIEDVESLSVISKGAYVSLQIGRGEPFIDTRFLRREEDVLFFSNGLSVRISEIWQIKD